MVSLKEMLGLVVPYIRTKIMEQIKAVALVVSYLVLFQTMVLGIPLVGKKIRLAHRVRHTAVERKTKYQYGHNRKYGGQRDHTKTTTSISTTA